MHGAIGFTTDVGLGSEFWVELPVAGNVASPAEASHVVEPSPRVAAPRQHTVVYVEDNPSNIAFMRGVVEDLDTIQLLTAATGEFGLEVIRAHHPDAVIVDINLPGISGFEVLRRLRDSPETRGIPVIALSASAPPSDAKRAGQAGFYRYLTKPVKVDDLVRVLEQLLDKP